MSQDRGHRLNLPRLGLEINTPFAPTSTTSESQLSLSQTQYSNYI
jgi:hypothetical protein